MPKHEQNLLNVSRIRIQNQFCISEIGVIINTNTFITFVTDSLAQAKNVLINEL